MRTIIDIPTKGDPMTNAGGIALRVRPSEDRYVVHYYYWESDGRKAYHQGGYHQTLSQALEDIARRVTRAETYDRGGALDFDRLLKGDYP